MIRVKIESTLHIIASSCCLLVACNADDFTTTKSESAPAFTPSNALLAESDAEKAARMQWWREARFGMFIHWGLYSVPAGAYQGRTSKGLAEWIMKEESIPRAEYEKYAGQFNPSKYDPEKWVKIAKDAGMKYIIITTKHHEGFALWDSKASDFNVVDATPYGKDLLKPLAQACKKHGIKLGFYYSILDWNHLNANRNPMDGDKDNNPDKDFPRYVREKMIPQLEELLANYGDVGVIWFDGEWITDWTAPQGKGLYNFLRAIEPDLIINNRVGKGRKGMQGMNESRDTPGDFGTPEQQIPAKGITDFDWESCMTLNETWGYRKTDHNWKSATRLIQQLIDTSSKGGNFLLNVGPTAEGIIPETSVERLSAIGDWLDVNSEAIHGSGPSPYDIPKWGRFTTKPGKLYAHIFEWPEDGKITISDPSLKAAKSYLLADAQKRALQTQTTAKGLEIILPAANHDKAATVLVIEIHK